MKMLLEISGIENEFKVTMTSDIADDKKMSYTFSNATKLAGFLANAWLVFETEFIEVGTP